MEVNLALLGHFVKTNETYTFNKKVCVQALRVRHFLEWMCKADIPATKSIYEIMKKKADTRYKPSEK